MKRAAKHQRPKRRARRPLTQSLDAQALAARIIALRDRIAPRLPDVDPSDLICVLHGLLRPLGFGRRFFLRQIRPGVYVP